MTPIAQPSVPGFQQAFAPPAAAPPQPQAQPPRFVFTLTDAGGQSGTVDENFVAAQLAQAGYGVKGVSPDGAHVLMADAKGEYEVPIRGMLAGLGWQVTSSRPVNADFENVQPGWRASMSNFSDDVDRHAYLLKNLGDLGMAEPRLEGGGDDWYVHNPQTGDWVALTNKPGFDTSDILPGAQAGVHALAAGAAGLAAAKTGPGAILAGTAGGAGAEALMRGLNAAIDPNFASVAGQNLGGQVKDVAISSAGDVLGGAGGAMLGGLASKAFGPSVARALSRPMSSTAAGMGRVAQPVGRGLNRVGEIADTEMGRYIASGLLPGVGGLVHGGFLAQAPAMAMRLPFQGAAAVGKSQLGQKILGPKLASSLGWGAQHALNAPSTSQMFGRAANLAAAPFRPQTPLGRATYARDYGVARGAGLSMDEARNYARGRLITRTSRPGTSRAFDLGAKIGAIPEGLEALGRPFERFGLGVTGLATKGLKKGGAALERGGAAAQRGADIARPLEPWLTRQPLTEEFIADPLRAATNRGWGAPQQRRTILAEEGF